jgi:tetratricopeptide (TPR) repeat protein
MQFDPNNPVIKLCAEGMNCEATGQIEKAKELFQQAWDLSSNDFEKFTSAHYLARNQKDPKDQLTWNVKALALGRAIHDESMKSHFSSLYLNVGKSYETLGDTESAKENYRSALQFSSYLPANAYGELIKSGISEALNRLGLADFRNAILTGLINKWCEQKELKPLSIVLPSYLGNLGKDTEDSRLISALSFLSSTRCLSQEDQSKIDGLVLELSATE